MKLTPFRHVPVAVPGVPLSPARALTNNYLKKLLLDAYLAFEALTDHPHGFFSFIDGYFPLLSSFDGCAKVAVNICIEKYLQQRMKQVIDMDLDAIWLVISMLSPMVFRMRLQFSQNTPVTFCPQNRKSNIIVVPARGHAPRSGDAQAADGQKLMERVRENKDGLELSEMLESMSLDGLKDLYRLCFGPRAPGISRYFFVKNSDGDSSFLLSMLLQSLRW